MFSPNTLAASQLKGLNWSDPSILLLPSPATRQKYVCTIPTPPSTRPDTELDSKKATSKEDSVEKALALLENLPCLIYAPPQKYWAYEFCFQRHVVQFHPLTEEERAAHQKQPGFVLGKYSGDATSADGVRGGSVQEIGSASRGELAEYVQGGKTSAYLRQTWSGGDWCDLNGQPRAVNVEYYCNTNAIEHIANVREIATCRYEIVIHTPRLCKDPIFVPHHTSGVQIIECSPVISDDLSISGTQLSGPGGLQYPELGTLVSVPGAMTEKQTGKPIEQIAQAMDQKAGSKSDKETPMKLDHMSLDEILEFAQRILGSGGAGQEIVINQKQSDSDVDAKGGPLDNQEADQEKELLVVLDENGRPRTVEKGRAPGGKPLAERRSELLQRIERILDSREPDHGAAGGKNGKGDLLERWLSHARKQGAEEAKARVRKEEAAALDRWLAHARNQEGQKKEGGDNAKRKKRPT
ncbi:Protein OS-9 [Borealophlyctis nickersoniae]|nr:Protein OS-9 [Borealophlyctis nickersoniae]